MSSGIRPRRDIEWLRDIAAIAGVSLTPGVPQLSKAYVDLIAPGSI